MNEKWKKKYKKEWINENSYKGMNGFYLFILRLWFYSITNHKIKWLNKWRNEKWEKKMFYKTNEWINEKRQEWIKR